MIGIIRLRAASGMKTCVAIGNRSSPKLTLKPASFPLKRIQDITEGLIAQVMHDVKGIDVDLPFQRITWQEAMDKYGSDKPDLRFDMQIFKMFPIL